MSEIKTIPSYEVAEMMQKKHWEVLRMLDGGTDRKGIIKVLTDNQMGVSDYFIANEYKDNSGKMNKYYECTKLGCDMLANKMTGEKGILFTARYVKRFEEMEKSLKALNTPSYMLENPIERAKRWIVEYQEKEQLQLENKRNQETIQKQSDAIQELAPKANYFDALVDRKLLTNIRDTAKELGIKERIFTEWLIQKSLCYRDKKGKIKPYANKMKYFELKDFTTAWGHSDTQTLITPRGKETFRLLLIKDGLIKSCNRQLTLFK